MKPCVIFMVHSSGRGFIIQKKNMAILIETKRLFRFPDQHVQIVAPNNATVNERQTKVICMINKHSELPLQPII